MSSSLPTPQEFDKLVQSMNSPHPAEIISAQAVITDLKKNPDAFSRCGDWVLSCQLMASRFFALQILEENITKRWNLFPEEQRTSLKSFLFHVISSECRNLNQMRANRGLLTKMNSCLVAVAKREWPHRWPSFVQDICSSAPLGDPLVENSIHLLALLGEDILEFGDLKLTSRWIERKKAALQQDFAAIFALLTQVMTTSQDTVLLNAVLKCFARYIPWFPFDVVFNQELMDFLATRLMEAEHLRLSVLRCLMEAAALPLVSGPQGDAQKQVMLRCYRSTMQCITNSLPTAHSHIEGRISDLAQTDEESADVICQFITTYMRTYLRATVHDDVLLQLSHQIIIGLTHVDSKEIFKTCVEYWWWLGDTLLKGFNATYSAVAGSVSTVDMYGTPIDMPHLPQGTGIAGMRSSLSQSIMTKLHAILSNARYALIRKMARPEEVIIVEDEGELRREYMTDVENLQLYQLMRESLIFLTVLNPSDTQSIMSRMMMRQLDRSEWSWKNINCLTWAVGSISGSMSVECEKDLFVGIVSDLLKLCKEMVGKENRAVIASCIMYVIGQYPRFLKNHTSFMRTVCRKLFEFMREPFPGVMDMAVDTFQKLTKITGEIFLEAGQEPKPFVNTIVDQWSGVVSQLTAAHKEQMFVAMGNIVRCLAERCEAQQGVAQTVCEEGKSLLGQLLYTTIYEFKEAVQVATTDFSQMADSLSMLRQLLHILRVFSAVASSCGPIFIVVMEVILGDLQNFYTTFSSFVSNAVVQYGQNRLFNDQIRAMRLIKREVLKIIELFVENTTETPFVATQCMPQIFQHVLTDYQSTCPLAREAGVLALVTACVRKLGSLITGDCGPILDHTFTSTTSMLLENMADFPEHRVQLFKLLHSLNENCFDGFLAYTAAHPEIVDGILWATKHTERNVMITGLELLHSLLQKVVASSLGEAFYTSFTQKIMTEVLVAAMDTLHTAGFQLHCSILQQVFQVSKNIAPEVAMIGLNAIRDFFQSSLSEIPTLSPSQIEAFMTKCYETCDVNLAFRQVLADFLVEIQVWGAEQENSLYQEEERRMREQLVPGLGGGDNLPKYHRYDQQENV